jgi:hypothetical protein
VKNGIFIPIFLSISTLTIPNKSFATKLISIKTEYFHSANSNFGEIYGSEAILGIGWRSKRDSGLIWGLELEYFSITGEPLDYPAKKSKKGLLVKGPDLSNETGVAWNMDRTSTALTVISFLSTANRKLLRGSPVSPNLSLKAGFSSAKERFSGEYEYDGSGG